MTTDKMHFLGQSGQRGQIAKRPTGDDRDVSLWQHRQGMQRHHRLAIGLGQRGLRGNGRQRSVEVAGDEQHRCTRQLT